MPILISADTMSASGCSAEINIETSNGIFFGHRYTILILPFSFKGFYEIKNRPEYGESSYDYGLIW